MKYISVAGAYSVTLWQASSSARVCCWHAGLLEWLNRHPTQERENLERLVGSRGGKENADGDGDGGGQQRRGNRRDTWAPGVVGAPQPRFAPPGPAAAPPGGSRQMAIQAGPTACRFPAVVGPIPAPRGLTGHSKRSPQAGSHYPP